MRRRVILGCVAWAFVACAGRTLSEPDPIQRDSGSDDAPGVGFDIDAAVDADSATDFDADAPQDADANQDGDAPDAAVVDDPCPPHVDIDCSTSCGGPTASCRYNCDDRRLLTADRPQLVARTPSSPESIPFLSQTCVRKEHCAGLAEWVYGFTIRVAAPFSWEDAAPPVKRTMRVRVAAPWHVRLKRIDEDHCWAVSLPRSCVSFTLNDFVGTRVVVATADPNAPARNVIFENTESPCP